MRWEPGCQLARRQPGHSRRRRSGRRRARRRRRSRMPSSPAGRAVPTHAAAAMHWLLAPACVHTLTHLNSPFPVPQQCAAHWLHQPCTALLCICIRGSLFMLHCLFSASYLFLFLPACLSVQHCASLTVIQREGRRSTRWWQISWLAAGAAGSNHTPRVEHRHRCCRCQHRQWLPAHRRCRPLRRQHKVDGKLRHGDGGPKIVANDSADH